MSFNNKLSHGKKFTFDSKDLLFTTLDEYIKENGNKIATVREVFINNKAKFGPRGCVVTDTLKINVPRHINNDIEIILNDPELIGLINNGKCGFKPTQYEDSNGVVRNSGEFIDI